MNRVVGLLLLHDFLFFGAFFLLGFDTAKKEVLSRAIIHHYFHGDIVYAGFLFLFIFTRFKIIVACTPEKLGLNVHHKAGETFVILFKRHSLSIGGNPIGGYGFSKFGIRFNGGDDHR
jgi:hypothetical protein